ncbi:hypothetical protein CHLRE_12g489153v5 [Chlamydomonas reinhardtii]|nr:ribosomal protein L31 [Chlamydomonas reinhardtii]PNW74640.1 hypothetical protein CHLRE_12g489153v5 [Chlamydomonas reinhardtii]
MRVLVENSPLSDPHAALVSPTWRSPRPDVSLFLILYRLQDTQRQGRSMAKDKSRSKEQVTREYTIHLSKRLHKTSFKKCAPKAVKEIRKFASKVMGTSDVRLDVKLNKAVWSKGIKNVPTRLRIVISRRRNDDEDAKEEMYSFVTVAEDQSTKGKGTVVVQDA